LPVHLVYLGIALALLLSGRPKKPNAVMANA